MRILSIVGTRPQYVKLAPILNASMSRKIFHDWVDTGQHYSTNLSADLIQEFEIPPPKLNLMVGSGPHGFQTARMLEGLEEFLTGNEYDVVLVYGDTNSTLAGALAATKLGIPVAHVEAGLRSGNMNMPEEKNRRAVDHISNLLFAPTKIAIQNLKSEGLSSVVFSGDVMFDQIKAMIGLSDSTHSESEEFVFATIHRAENTKSKERLTSIIRALENVSVKVVLAAHPRLSRCLHDFDIEVDRKKLTIIDPLSHKDLVRMVSDSMCVVTDSGGLQKEAFWLGKLCITARNETEWPETLEFGWNILNPNLLMLEEMINRDVPKMQNQYFGDGNTAHVILDELESRYGNSQDTERESKSNLL